METQDKSSWAEQAKRVTGAEVGGTNLASGISPDVLARMMAPTTFTVRREAHQVGVVSGVKKILDGAGEVAVGAKNALRNDVATVGKKLNEFGATLGEKAYDAAAEIGLAGPTRILPAAKSKSADISLSR